jgi:CheY-like chemotaxis protein
MSERSPTFLYVEDDPSSRKVLNLLLRSVMGFHDVTIFESSEGFVEKLRALPAVPNVIFLDIHMKPIDGFALLEILRSDPVSQNCLVVAMTASVMVDEISLLKNAGFDGLIAKPIQAKIFPELVRRILNGESVWYIS